MFQTKNFMSYNRAISGMNNMMSFFCKCPSADQSLAHPPLPRLYQECHIFPSCSVDLIPFSEST